MDKQVIYRKTPKGQDEMATRTHRLPARERSVLVLVDGRRNGAELIDKGRYFGDSEAFLGHLIECGFIEPVTPGGFPEAPATTSIGSGQRLPTKPPAGNASARGNPPPSPASMHSAITFARLFLLDTLGPDADALTARIETSRNLRELTAALEKSREALQVFAGKRKAELFWQEIRIRLPTTG